MGLPMWTQENGPRYNRDHLRYPSDLTDEEWAVIAPLIPPPRWRRQAPHRHACGGERPDVHPEHRLSVRYIPKDFPPRSTVYNYFVWWQCDRLLDRIH